ncbi:replication protein A 70 kDa DNA-binding subunit-like [Leptonychotes weddellii]|uniref:Replication protein A 70 kDa DNA-binding subunit-like n=1 Tax=Leptonychotes weddellii TaxID=9713 RepID=A0A7F8RIW9_LEPWE|nr:replication protein A 70 kDa DNA-binding subunit-like [Leptonychotes weddellii]
MSEDGGGPYSYLAQKLWSAWGIVSEAEAAEKPERASWRGAVMVGHLSEGAIAVIMQQGDTSIKPILQVINIRPIITGNSPPRYRLLMSDGLNTLSSFMLATQLNPLVEEERLSSNCICQINRFIVNTLKDGRRVVILMELDILKSAEAVGLKIGNPVPYNEGHGQQQIVPSSGHGQQQIVPSSVSAANPPANKLQQQNGSSAMGKWPHEDMC